MDVCVRLEPDVRALLTRWVRSPSSQQRVVQRSRIVLMLAVGLSQSEVSTRLGVSRRTVSTWQRRFLDEGPPALLRDRPGRGRPPGRRAEIVRSILHATANPPAGRGRWTARALAKELGISHSTVLRVWRDSLISEP